MKTNFVAKWRKRATLLLFAISAFSGVFGVKVPSYAHCTGYHPWHCDINDIRQLPQQIPKELEYLMDTACASTFVAYTTTVLATAGSYFWNKRVEDYLVRGGFFQRSDFYNVTAQYADLKGLAGGMVPAPNKILIDYRYRGASVEELAPLIAHEMVHVIQLRKMGRERFACRYSEYITAMGNAAFYDRNPLEREAYSLQDKVTEFSRTGADRVARVAEGRHVAWTKNFGDRIVSHREMPEGSFLQSSDGRWKMVVQGDGNLVVYDSSNRPIWASNTAGRGGAPFKLAVQADGNVVIYGVSGPTWATGTDGQGTGPYTLVMQNDANLVLYDANGAIWATNTCCR